ncbi:hypothetical protein DYB32_002936 [Aphanomyces invadans]|uniref:Uncharacterized protein n=1 Tax=Aphanomyces invadans TaxID=157072 RepID=A0A3R6VPR6_9STRA|nr:hypothetical protein DYB32_002936 [Aphanomyces invadans]
MMQSWNKLCIQGGFIEVAAKLPGAINNVPDDVHESVTTNPNAVGEFWKDGVKTKLTSGDRIKDGAYYLTWPGIWLLGNLGRALYSASTTRMWPWTYNECDGDLSPHQAISACDPNPGYGLNPNQGRGVPEMDILEGDGAAISSFSHALLQAVDADLTHQLQVDAKMMMAVVSAHMSWDYVGKVHARIADAQATPFSTMPSLLECLPKPLNHQACGCQVKEAQVNPVLVTSNVYNKLQVSAGRDANADLRLIDGKGTLHWGINYNGTYFPVANGYIGAFLCDPDAKNPKCATPRKDGVADTSQIPKFQYQMDAISANWDIGAGRLGLRQRFRLDCHQVYRTI